MTDKQLQKTPKAACFLLVLLPRKEGFSGRELALLPHAVRAFRALSV